MVELLQKIEEHLRPPEKSRWSRIASSTTKILGITGMTMAMSLSCTMFYILWFGFYPPNQTVGIFFMDRLYDFRDLIQGLRNGSIMSSFTENLVAQFDNTMHNYIARNNMTKIG